MKTNELKRILKPLIKECIKEVIFEDGVLSSVITEVAKGLTKSEPVFESKQKTSSNKNSELRQTKQRKKLLDAIGKDAYNGVDLFEGTTPMKAQHSERHAAEPLANQDPSDPGVDISSIFNSNSSAIWKKLSGK